MSKRSLTPSRSTSSRKMPSASGDRQMVPRHTKRTPILSLLALSVAVLPPNRSFLFPMTRHAAEVAAPLIACAGSDVPPAPVCENPQILATLPAQIHEASGIALSRRQPGLFWIHNDSRRAPLLYAVDSVGRVHATARLATVVTPDW